MRLLRRLGAVLLLAAAAVLGTVSAEAAPPAATLDTSQFTGGLRFATDELNLGFGARGGHTLPSGVYLGGAFDFYLGESIEITTPVSEVEGDVRLWMLTFEGGYDFGLSDSLVVRPFGGLGIAAAFGEVCTTALGAETCADVDDTDAAIVLGGLLYYVSGSLIVGPELRVIIVDDAALSIGANIGARF